MKRYSVFVVINFFLLVVSAKSQDKIYYRANRTTECKVTDIKPGFVKGRDLVNQQVSYSISPKNILFLFNAQGDFLVVPSLQSGESKSTEHVKRFLNANAGPRSTDQILTLSNSIISCNIKSETHREYSYLVNSQEATIPKTEVAAIIFKDGTHKIFRSAERVFRVLNSVQDEYYERQTKLEASNGTIASAAVKSNEDLSQSKLLPVVHHDSSKVQSEKVATSGGVAMVKNVGSTPSKPYVSAEKELSSATLNLLQEKALQNIRELESYIKIICDKQSDLDRLSKAIEQALTLFASEESMIEVSSANRQAPKQYKARVYLNRLGLVKYNKVVIEWYNVQYASKVRKNPDGSYSGIIEFEQRFTGMSGDRKLYQDITRKTVEIILKSHDKKSGGETTQVWEVFLGNIGLSVTNA